MKGSTLKYGWEHQHLTAKKHTHRLDDKEETESFIFPESYSHCTIMVVKQDDLF